jgi:RNA polymerase primary sigma factor
MKRSFSITQRFTDRTNIKLYLKDINKIPLLTPEGELNLFKSLSVEEDPKIKQKIIDKIVSANLRFVVSVAKQYQNQGLSLEDLISEGNVGLINSIDHFDYTKGFRFISYAVWWIRQNINRAVLDKSTTIRYSANHSVLMSKINKLSRKYMQEFERQPSLEELSKELNIPEEKLSKSYSYSVKCVSIDTPLIEDGGSLVDIIPNTNSTPADSLISQEYKNSELHLVLNTLSEREHDIILMYYGIGMQELTMSDIATRFNCTGERIGQIKNEALKKLQKYKNILLNE